MEEAKVAEEEALALILPAQAKHLQKTEKNTNYVSIMDEIAQKEKLLAEKT